MKFIRDRKELEHIVITMHNEGCSIHELKRQFHLGRNTIRRILRAH
jgi:Mor family transcriptional regulator